LELVLKTLREQGSRRTESTGPALTADDLAQMVDDAKQVFGAAELRDVVRGGGAKGEALVLAGAR
jgi:hypothetical protein